MWRVSTMHLRAAAAGCCASLWACCACRARPPLSNACPALSAMTFCAADQQVAPFAAYDDEESLPCSPAAPLDKRLGTVLWGTAQVRAWAGCLPFGFGGSGGDQLGRRCGLVLCTLARECGGGLWQRDDPLHVPAPQPAVHCAAGQGHAAVHGGPAHGDQQLPASNLQRPDDPGAGRCAAQTRAALSPVPPAVGSALTSLRSGPNSLPVLPILAGCRMESSARTLPCLTATMAPLLRSMLPTGCTTCWQPRTLCAHALVRRRRRESPGCGPCMLASARLQWCACPPANIHGPPRACSKEHPSQHPTSPACPALPNAGEGPPATAIQEEERVAAALVHSFEAVDREIMTRCRVEGTKGGATGLVVLRIGGPVVSHLSPKAHLSPKTHLSPKAHLSQPQSTTGETRALRAWAAHSSPLPCHVVRLPCSSHGWPLCQCTVGRPFCRQPAVCGALRRHARCDEPQWRGAAPD